MQPKPPLSRLGHCQACPLPFSGVILPRREPMNMAPITAYRGAFVPSAMILQ